MRLHRFYISKKLSGEALGTSQEFSINSVELTNQVRRVFRLKNGDKVILFDGTGFDFECDIFGGDKKSISFRVAASERSHHMPTREVYLCAAITKKDTFEWIVEKATELGVTHIIPVLAERSEKKSLNIERLDKIAEEASEQSGRGNVPKILSIMDLGDAIKHVSGSGARQVAFHTEGELLTGEDLGDNGAKKTAKAIFIGPEGGWSLEELDLFHREKISVRCLGNQILRAETAVVVALSKVMFPNI